MSKAEKWKAFATLLQTTRFEAKDPKLTYLHGILFGLDYPEDNYRISAKGLDQTVYYTIMYNTEKRNNATIKEILNNDFRDIDLERFSTPDPEQAEFYFRKHCNIKPNTTMNTVRGKFRVTKNVKTTYGNEVSLWAQYSDTPEDNSYSAATPSGQVTMNVTNPAVGDFFVEGKAYYLDFTPAE